MSDEQVGSVPVATPVAGQPLANDLQEKGGEQQEQQPQYVTRAEMEQMLEDVYRRAQSHTDKSANALGKQVREQIEELDRNLADLQAAGVKLTDQQRASMRDNIIRDAIANASRGGGEQRQGASPPAEPAPEILQANLVRAQEDARYGFTLMQNDPEVSMLDTESPESFTRTYPAALQAKAQRLGRQPQDAGNPAARVASSGGGTPAPDKVTELTQKLNQLLADPVANNREIYSVQKELTALVKR